ncbi:biopolymer transport protein TolR [endosymbiont of unidentified scaly snail isolate Monju]|nr:biopolymer transport protein TolR [endosymbiont of unidentified scaly snail isolate Monju]
MAEINVVPYIDVMLVLLVIFMITAPLLTEGVKVELPQADANPIQEDAQRPIVFTVDHEGRYYVTYDDDKSVPLDEETLLLKAAALIRHNPRAPVLVKGDRSVTYDRVVRLMVLLQQAGAASVGLLTDPT